MNASRDLGERVAAAIGVALAPHEEREFEDGEHKARPLASVRDRDAYVVHSLYGDAQQSANDKLVRLLFFLGALRDAGAARVTAVAPYLCYARKDRRSKPRDPVSTRYVAALLGVNVNAHAKTQTIGIGGKQTVYFVPVVRLKIGTAEREIPVGFVDSNQVPLLLGRHACLDTFTLVLDTHKKMLFAE